MKNSFLALTGILFLTVFAACHKNNDSQQQTSTPVQRTKTQILTYKPWIIQEEYELENNVLRKYERGQSTNTVNYDDEVLTFTSNNSGTFKDIYGGSYPITWSFTNAEQSKMRVTIQFPSANVPLDYNMFQLADSVFTMTFNQVSPTSGKPILASVKRVWKP